MLAAHLLYIPCASADQAQKLATTLLEQRLIACANLLPQMQSIYRWQGKIVSEPEILLLAKAPAHHFAAIEASVKAQHSYECPCIVAFDITAAHAPFIEWLHSQTRQTGDKIAVDSA